LAGVLDVKTQEEERRRRRRRWIRLAGVNEILDLLPAILFLLPCA
jgi:hypothetical protein